MGETEIATERLREEFCPPIDEPTFYAICSDYDLATGDGLDACLRGLGILKADALEADVTAFDPSGTQNFAVGDSDTSAGSQSDHADADFISWSQDADDGTLETTKLTYQDYSSQSHHFLDDTTDEDKVHWLHDIFESISEDSIRYRLGKCDRNITRTLDELLNWSFLAQSETGGQPVAPKGIDGFILPEGDVHARKGKGKAKRRMRKNGHISLSEAAPTGADGPSRPKNPWTSTIDDVEFIGRWTNYEAPVIKTIYDAHQKSLSNTVLAIASDEGSRFESTDTTDPSYQTHLAELRNNFPSIPAQQLLGLLVVCEDSINGARELAAAMIASPKPNNTGSLEIVTRYAPIDVGADSQPERPRSSTSWRNVNHSKAQTLAIQKATAGNNAFMQASKASRRAKSANHLGGAAAYYSAVAHENVAAAKELSSRAADGLVMSQSGPNMLDLHGVSVADAVRISREQVGLWWHALGDTKYAPGGGGPAREGYRVVTGVGRHSRRGAPQIGPAVSRMLVREGWKVTVGHGEILVTGRARRTGL